MSVVVNTNVDSLKIQSCLNNATTKMSSVMERMSTGLKVNSAKDDAAGCVIAAKMKVQLNGNKIAQNNVQSANAMLSTAEGNIDVIEENLSRIRDLTLQAKNGTYNLEEVKAMQDEVEQRINEIDRIATSSKYSSLQLFGDTQELAGNGALFQVGANKETDNTIKADASLFADITFSGMGATDAGTKFSLTTMHVATDRDAAYVSALEKLDSAITNITDRKSIIGSVQNRLDSAFDALTIQYENLSSAKSIITDADIGAEASNYTQQQILQQVSTSLLAQANQAPSIALSLV